MAERMTERDICSSCCGKGYTVEKGEDCKVCNRRGYLENTSGRETVCPACNGEGYLMENRSCKQCSGKGFVVCIYEMTNYSKACVPCGGTGCINQEYIYAGLYGRHTDQRQVECPVCHGRGVITDQRIKRIR